MLTQAALERVRALWQEPGWPEAIATDFAKEKHLRPFAYYLDRVRHLGISGETLIDAGCGSGTWAFAFASRFENVLGFDYTPDRVATALWLKRQFELPQVNFVEGDIRAMPARDGDADAVYCRSVALGSVPLKQIFAEAFRVLRPGGCLSIELNGIGYAYELLEDPKEVRRAIGQWTLYNTLCQTRLAPLAGRLAPGRMLNRIVRLALLRVRSPARLLALIGADRRQVKAAAAIESDLGPAFAETLLADIAAIASGEQSQFSNPTRGRTYEPEELRDAALDVGFDRFEWASDGYLSLAADGVVTKGPSSTFPPTGGEFRGHLRVFEALMRKPDQPAR